MQPRHKDRSVYFEESALSCRNYYIPYITGHTTLNLGNGCRVLEIGCGMGGNLSVFAEQGCDVTGIDIHRRSIEQARECFEEKGLTGTFICSDIFDYNDTSRSFDLIILHDSMEHIPEKERLMLHIKRFLSKEGILYIGFPAWRMPFGGHQQMAKNKLIANFPYIHLLPRPLFRSVFKIFGEQDSSIKCFLEIRDTRMSIEGFNRLVAKTGYEIVDRQFYLINPHYHVKFGLKPRKLSPVVGSIPYLRDFFTTTCYYLLKKS